MDNAQKQISDLTMQYLVKKSIMDSLESSLKEAQREFREIEMRLLPAAMDEANTLKFETRDGIEVKIKEDITMSLNAGDRGKAFAWLRANQKGDLIKNVLTIEFSNNQDRQATALAKLLQEERYNFTRREDANTGALKAVIRRDLENGVDVPLEVFGAYQWRRAIVKIKP